MKYQKLNTYFGSDGTYVISIPFVVQDGRDATIGLMSKGTYDFGVATRKETIQITSGEAEINDEHIQARQKAEVFVDEVICIRVLTQTMSYLCIYD